MRDLPGADRITPATCEEGSSAGIAIPALTVWQPWASLIMAGFKSYEFRSWAAPRAYRGRRIAIHAGSHPVRSTEIDKLIARLSSPRGWTTCLKPEALPFLERVRAKSLVLPTSHVVGTAVLGEPTRSRDLLAEFGGALNDSDRNQHFNFAWPLTEIRHLEPPAPARGAQGFWMWTPGAVP